MYTVHTEYKTPKSTKQSVFESLAIKREFHLIYCNFSAKWYWKKFLLKTSSRAWNNSILLLLLSASCRCHLQLLDQRPGLVLCRHHNGHASHAGDVGSCDSGGGQRRRGGGCLQLHLRLAVGLWQCLSLGQLGVALRPGEGAAVGAGLRGDGLAAWQGGVVVVAEVGGGRGSVALVRPIAGHAAGGGNDGGGVWGWALGVLLQLVVVVVVVVVGGIFVVWTGGDGRQGAVLGDDVWTHAALRPGHAFGSLSVLPCGVQNTSASQKRWKQRQL